MLQVDIAEDGKSLSLTDAANRSTRFHSVWLRDNSPDAETRDPHNGQRLVTLADFPSQLTIEKATKIDDTIEVVFQPENKPARFNIHWLLDNAYDGKPSLATGWLNNQLETWDATLDSSQLNANFADLQNNQDTLRLWLRSVQQYGFARVTGGPIKHGALFDLVSLFGYVRETNYGRHFEVRTEVNPSNLAYTGLGLQAHTDNPYRDPTPTLQILYCLESSAAGGDNMVVDGFHAASRLRAENNEWFDVLSQYCARFEYAGADDVALRTKRPMIELAPDGELIGVRFNNRSAAAFTDIPYEMMEIYYQAYRRFSELLDDPAMAVSFRLEPGDAFIVDNTRVLHARKAYSGQGLRWLQGCYADKDSLLSKLTVLSESEAAS